MAEVEERIARLQQLLASPCEDRDDDTLSRTLHPQPDRWARRVIQRCRDEYVAAASRGLHERTPA